MAAKRLILLLLVGTGLGLAGLVHVDDPVPPPGVAGAPHRPLSAGEEARFLRGRLLFDRDFGVGSGVGPLFNGDSCRACHQDPVVGGAGGIDLQVQRPQISDGEGGFTEPPETGGLAQTHCVPGLPREEIPEVIAFIEERNSPSILGLGLVELIPEDTIKANADPDDDDRDGIRGIAHILEDGSLGRFGWKAQVPDLESFVRDAMGNELGITVADTGSAFGFIADEDVTQDPELQLDEQQDMAFFLRMLDFAPKLPETQQIRDGEALFHQVGCAECHIPVVGGVEAYSDFLLHDVQPDDFVGVTQGEATSGLYRAPPLRGVRDTAPYFHDGRSETLRDAALRHDGEALAVREDFEDLSPAEQAALIAFIGSL